MKTKQKQLAHQNELLQREVERLRRVAALLKAHQRELTEALQLLNEYRPAESDSAGREVRPACR